MTGRVILTAWLAAVVLLLPACGAPAPTTAPTATEPEPASAPAETSVSVPPTPEPTATPEPTGVPLPEPVRVEFEAEGVSLVGIYYPPAVGPAPGVLLMHQMGVDKSIWQPLIAALWGTPSAGAARMAQPARAMSQYAVFAFDFPEHGESGGPLNDRTILGAAREALELFRTFDGVNPEQIVMVGASIGADASVDECNEGCVGAVPISPGSYMGVMFTDALRALKEKKDPPVLCIASQGDTWSRETCREGEAVGLTDYQVHVYDGDEHGNFLFFVENLTPPPPILELIMNWLAEHLPLP